MGELVMDSLRSIIDDNGEGWKGKRVSLQIIGDVSIICTVEGDGDSEVSSERSIITVERVGDESAYNPSIVSIAPEKVTRILKILFDSYRIVGDDREETQT